MNMEQPDPGELFNQFAGQSQADPASRSVISQIGNRPNLPAQLPDLPPQSQPQPQQQQPAVILQPQQPVNPFVVLYRSGQMEKSIKLAEALRENPFTKLYESGAMETGILQAEDNQYKQDIKTWEKRKQEYIPYRGMGIADPVPVPQPPVRDFKTIQQNWGRNVHYLRDNELGQMFSAIESGNMTPEQEAFITRNIEPVLDTDLRKQLQLSRLTRDKYQEMKAGYDQQMAEQAAMKEQKPLTGLDWEARRQATSPAELEQLRGVVRGATFNYAFAPDEDRLNSNNIEEAADERAKRQFYRNEQAEYPVSSMGGYMMGAMAPIGLTGQLFRAGKVAQAGKALKAGPPTAETAGIIARAGAPATTAGTTAEGAAISLPYDIASRPEGSEDMTLAENIKARAEQVGTGLAMGVAGDLFLTKALPALWSKTGAKVKDIASIQADKVKKKRLDKKAKDPGYKDLDDLIEQHTEVITDETGTRIRLKQEALEQLPGEPGQTPPPATTEAPHDTTAPPIDTQPTGRLEEDRAGIDLGPAGTPENIAATAEAPPPVTTKAQPIEPTTTAKAEPVTKGSEEPSVTETVKEEPPTKHKITGYEIVEAPVSELTLSADVPQFKSGANQQGVVEPLGGTFERTGVAPIQVWVRNDGSNEVISGRHRLDLAKRSGEETIPAQYHYESEGFGKEQAAGLDALLNIREGQGKVKDYVEYFQTTKPTEAEADADGVLARATGRRAYTIATQGTDTLITAHRAGRLTDEAATRIAQAAPNNEALQAVGIKAIQDGKSITVAENMVKAVRTMTDETAVTSGDMFGFDDSALKEAETLARKAAAKQAEIQRTLSAVQGAAKNPELAAKEGVDVKDPEAVKARIAELKQQKQDWQNWHTNPELTAELKGETTPPTTKQEPETPTRVDENQQGFDLTSQTETELAAKDKATKEAEAKAQQEQQTLEAKAKADAEAKDFELGIQGSGKDVSAKQDDLLGLGKKAQHKGESRNKSSDIQAESPLHIEPGIIKTEGLPKKEAVKNARAYAKENFAGSPVTNIETGHKIIITMSGVRHTTSGATGQNLLETIPYTPDILEKAHLVETTNFNKGKKDVLETLYFELPLEIKGDVETIRATVFRKKDGHYYYDHSIKVESPRMNAVHRPHSHRNLEARPEKQVRQGNGAGTTKDTIENSVSPVKSQKKNLRVIHEGEITTEPISETVHPKTGEPMWSVKVIGTLPKEKFSAAAKRTGQFGGTYSKGQFLLPSHKKAEDFIGWLTGKEHSTVKTVEPTSSSLKSSDKTSGTTQTIQAEAPKESPDYTPVTNKPAPKEKNMKGGPYTLDFHSKLFNALGNNKLSVDNFKEAFNTLLANKDEVLARLNKHTKKELMAISRQYAENKSQAVQQAYDRLLNRFLLDSETPSLEWEIFGSNKQSLAEAKARQHQKIADTVNNMTQNDLDSFSKKVSEGVEKIKKERAAKTARMDNPQTLEDYQLIVNEKGKEALTKAQNAEYEKLTAEAQWQAREKENQKKTVIKAPEHSEKLEVEPIEETTHTKTGSPVFNVRTASRMDKQTFQQAVKTAEQLGGRYWRGKGLFYFKDKSKAEQFVNWLNGKELDQSPKTMAQETAQNASNTDKLRTLADKLEEQGNTEYNAERTTNTPRQMDQAATARSRATKKINFARTLRNIANGIEDGSIKFLSKLTSLKQLETLQSLKRRFIPSDMYDSSYNGYSMSRSLKEGVTLDDYIDRIHIPEIKLYRDDLKKLAEQLKGKRGYADLRKELEVLHSVAIRSDKNFMTLAPHSEHASKLDTFVRNNKVEIGHRYQDTIDDIKRLQRMGLTTDEQLRAAVRELEGIQGNKGIKQTIERKLEELRFKIKQAARSFNDFFPTPETVVNRILELADIKPGMKTLEPNAGMGHIASKLQNIAGKEHVDLVEFSSQLADYLRAAGHDVTHSDFLKFGQKDRYDRIVMNPPFSKDQDIDHVLHAYSLLKPGGKLTAIVSNMAGLRSNKKNRAFSEWLDEVGAHVEDLDPGSFKSSFNPTSVNTKVVVIEKPVKAELHGLKDETPASGKELYSFPVFQTGKDLYRGLAGGIYGGAASEYNVGSEEWWADVALWSVGGAVAGKALSRLGTDIQSTVFYKKHLLPFNLWATKNRPLDANQFTKAPNGSLDFGFITKEIANSIGSTPGAIRVQKGWDFLALNEKDQVIHRGFGLRHIERDERLKNLEKHGYGSPKEFVFDVAQNFERIYKGRGDSFIIARDSQTGKHAASVFIQFERGKDGSFYATNSGLIAQKRYLKNKELLWDRSAVRSGIKPQESASRQQAVPTGLRQSSSETKISPSSVSVDKKQPQGTTLYSNPVILAVREVANMIRLNPGSGAAGAVYGGIEGADKSESEPLSAKWWLGAMTGAVTGAALTSLGVHTAKTLPIRGKTLLGKNSYGNQALDFIGQQFRKLPGMNPGDKQVIELGKRQRLMKMVIQEQAEQAGKYLLDNFTPAERAKMADLIEQRGIIAEGNLLHRQAKELDDFIQFTGKKLQELDMLDKDIELGGYLHRYYTKDLGISGLINAIRPKGKTLSGSWSKRRGLQEVQDGRHLSQGARNLLSKVSNLQNEYKQLGKKSGDLIDADTQTRMDEIKAQLKELQATELREYTAPQNGKLTSFFMLSDEVPVIPGFNRDIPRTPATEGQLEGLPPTVKEPGPKGNLALTDRRWTIDGMKGDRDAILHRDWTKAERENWGEIHDAAYRMVRGQAEVAHDLSLGTFYKTVNDRFQGTKVSDTEIEGWKKVPDTKIGKSRLKKYGALSGKYVTDDVWKAIKNHGRNPLANMFNNHPAIKTYLATLGKWKAYKTVYNPVSHMNNTISNLQMYYLSDHKGKYLAKAFKELRSNGALVQEAKRAGLFGSDWTSSLKTEGGAGKELETLLERLRTQSDIPDIEDSVDAVMGLKQHFINGLEKTGKRLWKPVKYAAEKAQQAYRMEDEFFKTAVYISSRDKGLSPSEAVREANNYFFDYNDMPDGMKFIRDFPIGSPFISYSYFAMPALARTAIEKPEKILALLAGLEGFNYAAMAINGDLQEQGYWDRMADEDALYPDWMKGRTIWGGVNNLSIPFVESYKLSLANANVGGNPFMGQSKSGEWWPEVLSFWGAGPEGSNPIAKLLFDISRNQDWKGNPIAPEGAPTSEKVRKALNYTYQNLTPSNPFFPGSYHQQKILEGLSNEARKAEEEGEPNSLIGGVVSLANAASEAIGGSQFTGLDRSGNEILVRDGLLGSVGLKVRPVRSEQFRKSKLFELNKKVKDQQHYLRNKAREHNQHRITDKQFNEIKETVKQELTRLKVDRDLIEKAAKNAEL